MNVTSLFVWHGKSRWYSNRARLLPFFSFREFRWQYWLDRVWQNALPKYNEQVELASNNFYFGIRLAPFFNMPNYARKTEAGGWLQQRINSIRSGSFLCTMYIHNWVLFTSFILSSILVVLGAATALITAATAAAADTVVLCRFTIFAHGFLLVTYSNNWNSNGRHFQLIKFAHIRAQNKRHRRERERER